MCVHVCVCMYVCMYVSMCDMKQSRFLTVNKNIMKATALSNAISNVKT